MAAWPVPVGLIGCGNISGIYLENAARLAAIRVVACADLRPERAAAQARAHDVPRACPADELLADPQIEVVLNLTIPAAHAEVARAALRAGKSVYNEKPLALTRAEGRALLDTAAQRGLRVGCAPDTVLGAGLQTARQCIDRGDIGTPVAATACMVCHGHEGWHPDPEFYYQPGGGPLFDMGPYYLTALITLLGPVRRVCGATRRSFATRTITSAPRHGQVIAVQVPTHIAGVLEFAAGPVATLVTSFDIWHAQLPLLEVYGAEGSLSVPDPNSFGGPVRLRRAAAAEWEDVPLAFGYAGNSRGLGLADMAHAMRTGRPHRADGALAYHVLDIMHALHESAADGRHIELKSSVPRPAPMVAGLPAGTLDD